MCARGAPAGSAGPLARQRTQQCGRCDARNHGSPSPTASSADRRRSKKVELHTHLTEGDVAKMGPVEAIEVKPGTPTLLEPGGLHIMLVELAGKLDAGNTMPLTLEFENAGEVSIDVRSLSQSWLAKRLWPPSRATNTCWMPRSN